MKDAHSIFKRIQDKAKSEGLCSDCRKLKIAEGYAICTKCIRKRRLGRAIKQPNEIELDYLIRKENENVG